MDLSQWADTYTLKDVWRHYHPHGKEYTCHSTTYRALSRIDLAFASTTALHWVREVQHLNLTLSLSNSPEFETVASLQALDTKALCTRSDFHLVIVCLQTA